MAVYAWQRAFAEGGFSQPPFSPHDLVDLGLRWAVFVCWTLAKPLLLAGLGLESPLAAGRAGLLLLAAAVIDAVDGQRMLRRARSHQNLSVTVSAKVGTSKRPLPESLSRRVLPRRGKLALQAKAPLVSHLPGH